MVTKTQDIIALENAYVLHTYNRPDFVLERGDGVYVYDTEGKRYLDLIGGIAVNALGYADSEILDTIHQQAERLLHVSNLYHTEPHARLAQLLVEHSFAQRVFFCNSGTESVEAALKFARKWARRNFGAHKNEFLTFTNSFHGRTLGALSVTHREKYRTPFEPLIPGVRFANFNDLDSARENMSESTCAVIVEPVQGEGGVNLADEDFLRGLRDLCDSHRALLILDEVQCGVGRTGYLWAHEFYGVEPDIMCLAKPLGGGLPLGATLVTDKVAQAIEPGDHGSTFAANPLICNVARVVFQRISDPQFLTSVREKGEHLSSELLAMKKNLPVIRDVRGRGLIWGMELAIEVQDVVQRGYRAGLLMGSAGTHVLRLLPPLTIEGEHVTQLIQTLYPILEELSS